MATPTMIVEMSDTDLLARMRNFEDNFVERKVFSDSKDWLKTAVAFANSAPVGFPAVLYIGVKDDGQIEEQQANLDSIQKSFNEKIKKAYPSIPCIQKVLSEGGRHALAVIILGSPNRPHFSGPAYIRRGSRSELASDQQFGELVATRNSKVSRMLDYKNKIVSVINRRPNVPGSDSIWPGGTTIVRCDQFYLTLATGADKQSFPLNQIDLSFDDKEDRLLLIVYR